MTKRIKHTRGISNAELQRKKQEKAYGFDSHYLTKWRKHHVQSQEIHDFLHDYFVLNQCEILEKSGQFLSVKLTVDLDKALMNRPFYWHYLEKTGGEANPSVLNFVTDWTSEENKKYADPKKAKDIEKIHFGSTRLHQIFEANQKVSSHIRLYENCQNALFPWLCQNFIISYKCEKLKSVFLSVGLNLINGNIIEDFDSKVGDLDLKPKIADLSYTLHPFITLNSGLNRLENYVKEKLSTEDNGWAVEARYRLENEINLLNEFYEDDLNNEIYQKEVKDLNDLFTPKIDVRVLNGGLFYLSNSNF
ncbi:MAG: hypothetical protein K0R71_2333 [Bacillales bacterium]|jgi:hypothetical protein|nr:hypothetical protein [Bacillales bacterium]